MAETCIVVSERTVHPETIDVASRFVDHERTR